MDISRFNTEIFDGFQLYEYFALFSFKTPNSISFSVDEGSWDPEEGPRSTITNVGWLDVHYPTSSFYKTQIRIKIPEQHFLLAEPVMVDCHPGGKIEQFHNTSLMYDYIEKILKELKIDPEEHYEAYFLVGENPFGLCDMQKPGTIS